LIIYFAGHGVPDPDDPANLYLLTYDAKKYNVHGTAYPMFELENLFAHIVKAGKVVTLVDMCHAYGLADDAQANPVSGSPQRASNLVNQYIEHFAGKADRAVITASDIAESSFEDAQWGGGHGVFTYYLLQGLAGAADSNHDGTVTTGELFAFLQKTVAHATNERQHPRATAGFAAALPLSRASAAAAQITGN
jgi:uncharacterized caspase-like protein